MLDKQIVEYDFLNTYDVKSFIEIQSNVVFEMRSIISRNDGGWDLSHGIGTCQGLISDDNQCNIGELVINEMDIAWKIRKLCNQDFCVSKKY